MVSLKTWQHKSKCLRTEEVFSLLGIKEVIGMDAKDAFINSNVHF